MNGSPFQNMDIRRTASFAPPADSGDSVSIPSQFPTDCLPGICGEMARQVAKAAMVPESLASAAVIGTVAAALGSGLEVQSGGQRRTRGNLFLLPLAQTGTGKDLAYNLAVEPLQSRERDAREKWAKCAAPELKARHRLAAKKIKTLETRPDSSDGTTAAELENAIREMDAAEAALASSPLFIVTDATREALAAAIATQPGESLALMTPEGRGALSNILGRYSKGNATDEDLYCAFFSGTPVSQQRRTKAPIDLRRPCLTILLMVQPDIWTRLSAMDVLTESGLLPRFLPFDAKAEPEPLPLSPHCIPSGIEAAYSELVLALCDQYRLHVGETHCIACPLETYGILRDFDNECRARRRTGGDVSDIAGFAARWAEQAWRLSVGLHAMEHGRDAHRHDLSERTVANAIVITRWFIEQQLMLLRANRSQKREEKTERLLEILRKHNGEITLRALRDRHNFSRDEVLGAVRDSDGRLEVAEVRPEIGRPSERLRTV